MTLATNKSLPLSASSFEPSNRFTPERTSLRFCASLLSTLTAFPTSTTLGKKSAKTLAAVGFTRSQRGRMSLSNALFWPSVGQICAIPRTLRHQERTFSKFLKPKWLDSRQKFLAVECLKSFLSDYFLKGMQRYGLSRDRLTGARIVRNYGILKSFVIGFCQKSEESVIKNVSRVTKWRRK